MTEKSFNNYVREQFPAMQNLIDGHPAAYLDGPGGYQVPDRVIKAVENYYINMNSNVGGSFATSILNDEMMQNARNIFSDFFNCSWDEVVFGTNMTTLNFALALAISDNLAEGDRIIITEMEHEANRGPWLYLKNKGLIIDDVKIDPTTCMIDMDDFSNKLNTKTKVVAVTHASNCVGTIVDVKKIIEMAKTVGALTVVDAVHYAAHRPIDVQELGTDFLLCSAYKFFGPHIGVMYAKKDLLKNMRTLKVEAQPNYPPYMIETGTLNHEGIAGAAEAVEFIADLGLKFNSIYGKPVEIGSTGRRKAIINGLRVIETYEESLTNYLINELKNIENVKMYGPPDNCPRTSTVSITYNGFSPKNVAKYLGDKGIFVWDGDFYAVKMVEKLGLQESGGLIRIGIAPYNTNAELMRLLDALKDKEAIQASINA